MLKFIKVWWEDRAQRPWVYLLALNLGMALVFINEGRVLVAASMVTLSCVSIVSMYFHYKLNNKLENK